MALSNGFFSRLCRPTVRKGSAFPVVPYLESSEAPPRDTGGVASEEQNRGPESRRLSALGGGQAAVDKLNVVLFVLACAIGSQAIAQEPVASPAPAPKISAQQTLKLPVIAIDYRADATKPLPAL